MAKFKKSKPKHGTIERARLGCECARCRDAKVTAGGLSSKLREYKIPPHRAPMVKEMLDRQREHREKQLGRPLRDDDLIFGEDDIPENSEIADELREMGFPPDKIYAFEKTERLVTEENAHNLTDEEIEEWNAAIDEYHALVEAGLVDDKGMVVPDGNTRVGGEGMNSGRWTNEDVARVLQNPFYAINIHPMLAQPHEALVDREQWIEANAMMIENGDTTIREWLARLLDVLEGGYK